MENFYSTRLHNFFNQSAVGVVTEEGVLSLVTVLGSSVSLVGLVFAFITYSLFSDLRNLSGTSLMNLIAALFMSQLLYVIGVGGIQDSELCLGLATALHYMRLAVFCWMLIMSYQMHKSYVESDCLVPPMDHNMKKYFWKLSLFGWGLPLVFMALAVFIQKQQVGQLYQVSGIQRVNCWFFDSNAFLYTFAIPVAALLTAIVAYLIKTSFVIRKTVAIQIDQKVREKMRKKRKLQLELFIRLTTVMTAAFFIACLHQLTKSHFFWILYNAVQGIQGILVTFCVTCNCHVLKIYSRSLKKRKTQQYGAANRDFFRSTSLQLLTCDPDIV